MNWMKEFIAGLKQGLREFDRAQLEMMDEFSQEDFERFLIISAAIVFLWPLLSFVAYLAMVSFW